ncbi:MAG: hypothetical protein LPK07_12265 [Hymenobacteraceae bacterium]|nr:hypothetical protein [Hymenobacteraceae bacterium]MDX5482447.1 hypothetical protein [Hymenobacteraceae bacterium]
MNLSLATSRADPSRYDREEDIQLLRIPMWYTAPARIHDITTPGACLNQDLTYMDYTCSSL